MSRQSDLETVLRNASWGVPFPTIEAMAAAAVAKGWAPQTPSTVDNVDNLEAFPLGTIVRTGRTTYARVSRSFWGWTAIGEPGRVSSEQVYGYGDVTLLFAPVVE